MTKRWIVLAITSTAACRANASASIEKLARGPRMGGLSPIAVSAGESPMVTESEPPTRNPLGG